MTSMKPIGVFLADVPDAGMGIQTSLGPELHVRPPTFLRKLESKLCHLSSGGFSVIRQTFVLSRFRIFNLVKHSGSIFQRSAARASSQRASTLALASGNDGGCLAHKRCNSYRVGTDRNLLWERGEEDEMKTPARETFTTFFRPYL